MRIRALAAAAALAVTLTACSGRGGAGDSPETPAAPAAASDGAVTFVGTDSLQWEQPPASATLGEDDSLDVTIRCAGAVPHNIVFEGLDDDAIIAECAGDDSATTTLEVEPGTYTYYCSIPGHRNAGMEGEITVS